MSLYRTSSNGIRIFKCKHTLKDLVSLNSDSIMITMYKTGYDVKLIYGYSLDGNNWNMADSSQELVDLIKNDPLVQLLEKLEMYFSFRFEVEANKVNTDYSDFRIESIKIEDIQPEMEVEIGRMLEETIIRTSGQKTFRAYKYNDNAKKLYQEISIGINEMFGFDVIYFKTEPGADKSLTFKSYDLFNVVDVQRIRLSIKDNEIPEALERFDEMGFDFQNELILHIVKHEFERVFGIGSQPGSNDFIYLALTDKMYQLNSPYDPKSFMQYAPFWEVMTTKYEKRSKVIDQNEDDFHKVDDMIDFTQNYLADEEIIELADAVKDYNFAELEPNVGSDVIISSESPIQKDMEVVYSFSTINMDKDELAKKYDFYQKYDDVLMLTMWLKTYQNTGLILSLNSIGDEKISLKRFDEQSMELTIEQEFETKSLIIPNKDLMFNGLVMVIDDKNFNLVVMIVNKKMEVIHELETSIFKFKEKLNSFTVYGNIKYSLLRVCKNLEKYEYDDLLQNELLPSKKDFVVMSNATPPLKASEQNYK